MNLAYTIRRQREIHEWSQEELAVMLHVSRQSVSKWESGRSDPSLDMLVAMSDLFDVTLDQLIKGDMDFKQRVLEGEYDPRYIGPSRLNTLTAFFADFWWTIFPIAGVFVWVVERLI